MIGAALLAHLVGDYLIQSDWMANLKTKPGRDGWVAAVIHGVTYTLPYMFISQNLWTLLIIGGTHAVIDHYRLAKYVVWARNQLAPASSRFKPTPSGSPADRPDWLTMWLLFIADNVLHLLINVAAIMWIG